MKIAIACQSPLLQKALELFLAQYLSTQEECDMVIRDTITQEEYPSPVFWITSDEHTDVRKPFSKEQLLSALQRKMTLSQSDPLTQLQARIIALTTQYQTNLLKTIQEFHEQH